MPYRNLEPISKQLTIVIGLTVVGFMTFGLALSFYRNVLFEETLQNISAQNQKLKENILQSQQDLEYYRSAQYKDKYAKENLGRITPGENVLIISQNDQSPVLATGDALSPSEQQQAAYDEILRQMPTIQHWNLYLFHRDKLEELRRGL
ncbi:hypothetical protein HY285_04720 [Candidatus Peregrinibacteria bacterium]|nr:hypothetical protein [Candidatus Peregrinibacteria bacterium]MBI3816814.1 hypothetical protein [Candidatus Peregrinibacteria bacterium]